MSAGDKPTGTLTYDSSWTHNAITEAAIAFDEGSGTPAMHEGSGTPEFNATQVEWNTTGDGDLGIRNVASPTVSAFSVPFGTMAVAAGAIMVIYDLNSVDTTNIATLFTEDTTNETFCYRKSGVTNSQLEAGNIANSYAGGEAHFETTGYHVLVTAWTTDDPLDAGVDVCNVYDNGSEVTGSPVAGGIGGLAGTSPLNLLSNGVDADWFADATILGVVIFNDYLTPAQVATLSADEWGWLSSGGPVITDVDTDEAWTDGDTGLIATGTDFY